MPIDLIRVLHVSSLGTANPAVTQHLINGETVEPAPRFVQYFTLNDLRASLCITVGMFIHSPLMFEIESAE